MIIHGSRASIIAPTSGGVTPTGRPTAVLRDWIGHEEDSDEWYVNRDLLKSGTANGITLTVDLPGPYDITNQCHIESGSDYMVSFIRDVGWSSDPYIEIAAWVKLDDLPTVVSEQTLGFVWIYNVDNDYYIGLDFVIQSNGDVYLEAFHGQNGFTRYAVRSSGTVDNSNWVYVGAYFDHNTLGNNVYLYHGANPVESGRPGGDIAASTYDEMQVSPQPIGVDEVGIRFTNLIFGRTISTSTNRSQIRGFTTQAQYDAYLQGTYKVQRLFKCREWELGVSLGDRFIHDTSGQLHPGLCDTGTLTRGGYSPGPLDYSTSHVYTNSAVSSHDVSDVTVTTYNQTILFFFRQSVSFNTNNDWFIRLEDSAGGYVELERRNDGPSAPDFWRLRFRLHPSDGSGDQVVDMDITPLFDGFWHRVAWTMGPLIGNWKVLVDGVTHMGALPVSVPTQLGQPTFLRYGNIELNMCGLSFVNSLDTDSYTIFNNVTTQQGYRDYCKARNYVLHSRMQNTITGAIP